MVLKIHLILLFVQVTVAINYRSTILNQKINHYENPYVDFDVKFYGDEGYPYFSLNDNVTPYDDLHIMLYAKTVDEAPRLLTHAPLSVCQLLHDEETLSNYTISQYNILQIFNFEGRRCPIAKGKIRLSPYMFPSRFQSDVQLGCGYMNLEARLMKCSNGIENDSHDCETLLKTTMLTFFINDDCNEPNVINYHPLSNNNV